MPYLGTFRQEFEKTIVIFEISSFAFVKTLSFMFKKNKLVPKSPYLGIFGLEFEKVIAIFETSTLSFIEIKFLTL